MFPLTHLMAAPMTHYNDNYLLIEKLTGKSNPKGNSVYFLSLLWISSTLLLCFKNVKLIVNCKLVMLRQQECSESQD